MTTPDGSLHELDRTLREGVALHDAGRFEGALALYDTALIRWPEAPLLWNNRATTLLETARFEEAAASYRMALQLVPKLHDARVALATCLQALGRVEEALAETETVLAQAPDHAEAHWNRALVLLLTGRYAEGWREYEWRWRKRRFTSPPRRFVQPVWQGEDPAGRTILIHAEQGFGDTLQFCRYLPLLCERGATVLFECHPPLAPLMATLDPRIQVYPMGSPLPAFDCHLPLLSLPLWFNTTATTIPAAIPYLTPPADRLPFWRSLLPQDGSLRVGLCWAGKPYPDPGRSIPADLLAPLAALPGITFVSLLIGEGQTAPPLPLTDLTVLIRDFADTAALIAQLDLVVTIDTAVAHLAGALGKPVLVLLPCAPDWRWGLAGEQCPWYPTARLYRQERRGAWSDVLEQLVRDLRLLRQTRQGC
ncbi:tetratricopeptide repeat protein [Trichlorobacter ammonificans]|uniref:TPR repeat-containing protein n=1 Tax=Trichlorobacter ammonificans TaxID=2916410 RepID=A0ABM9DA05_9BACT|nr:tetratricopeptide repeat protein [Trichlorobacter ammonificans]CAH2031439.1 TPR repeat-containing protein [Trichlorobacter ammonificans]